MAERTGRIYWTEEDLGIFLQELGQLQVDVIFDTLQLKMDRSIYDPGNINDDAFSMGNMQETTTAKIFTDVERAKLESITPGATPTPDPEDILSALLTVDGAGSLLDADLLDGINSTLFALKTNIAAGTITPAPGALDFSNGATGDILTKQGDGSIILAAPAPAGLPAADNISLVKGFTDPTKQFRVEVDPFTTATIRVLTPADRDWTPTVFGEELTEVANAAAALTKIGALGSPIANTNLAQMEPATFKMRLLGAGTGVPVDGTAAQAKTALAITSADITGTFGAANIADDSITNVKLADMPNLTIKCNVSGVDANPQDVTMALFKTNFGLGDLAFKSQIGIADISVTSGTPSISTYYRGDGAFASILPTINSTTVDITDGTVLTTAHLRYRIASNVFIITQLNLLNTTPANPVRIIMPDDVSVTSDGAEFSLVVDPTQMGLCVIRAQINGTINGIPFAVNAVASSALTAASGANVDISNLPAAVIAGSVFEMRTHSVAGNNGFYRRTAIGTTCTKLSGINPVNAAAEAVDIDSGYIAFGGELSSAGLVIKSNAGALPIGVLEGETFETKVLRGDIIIRELLQVTGLLDIDADTDFSKPITLSGTANIIGGGKLLSDIVLKDTGEQWFDASNKSGAVSFDYRDGLWQKCVATGNWTSITVTNWPASGNGGRLELEIHQDAVGSRTVTWNAGVHVHPGGTNFVFSTTPLAIDKVVLSTSNGGTTVFVSDGGKAWAA